jgi:hypothetical protein
MMSKIEGDDSVSAQKDSPLAGWQLERNVTDN